MNVSRPAVGRVGRDEVGEHIAHWYPESAFPASGQLVGRRPVPAGVTVTLISGVRSGMGQQHVQREREDHPAEDVGVREAAQPVLLVHTLRGGA